MESAVKFQVRHVLNREDDYVWSAAPTADCRGVMPVLSWVLADIETAAGHAVSNVVLPVTAAGVVTSGVVFTGGFRDGEDLSKRASARQVAAQWGDDAQQAGR